MDKDFDLPVVVSDWHLQKLCRRADALGGVRTRCCVDAVTLDLVNWEGVSHVCVRVRGNHTSPGKNMIAQTDHSIVVRSGILEVRHV